MILLVGLGNPGKKYQNNRHNVGHIFIDYLEKKLKSRNSNLKLIKTDCFMNESGKFFVNRLHITHADIKNLIVVHDDLDIPLGKFHIQKSVGPQLHNGLESIEQSLKNKDFWRIRLGVDNRNPDNRANGEKYVLQNFLSDEKNTLEQKIFPEIFNQLEIFLKINFSINI